MPDRKVTFTGAKGDSLWLFSLEGTMEPVSSRDVASPLAAMMDVEIAPGDPDLAAGEATYRQICTACHGDNGLGAAGHEGVALTDIAGDMQGIVNAVSRGQNERMPAFAEILTPEQIRDVAGFVSRGEFD